MSNGIHLPCPMGARRVPLPRHRGGAVAVLGDPLVRGVVDVEIGGRHGVNIREPWSSVVSTYPNLERHSPAGFSSVGHRKTGHYEAEHAPQERESSRANRAYDQKQ
jgi:hypothetical protein